MIVVSSSASFGSAGVTMTSDVFSTFIWRRSPSGSDRLSYFVASFASLTAASMDSWLMRALTAAGVVGDEVLRHPACPVAQDAELQQRLVGLVEKHRGIGGRRRRGCRHARAGSGEG